MANNKHTLRINAVSYNILKDAPILPSGHLECPDCEAGEDCQTEQGQLTQYGLLPDTGKMFPLFVCQVCHCQYTWQVIELDAWGKSDTPVCTKVSE